MRDIKKMIIMILAVSSLFLCFYFPNKITKLEQTRKLLLEHNATMQERNDFFSLNFELDCKMTGHKAPDILCAKGREKEVVGLSKLVTDKPVVIYKYSDLNCNTCYEEGLKELQEVMGNFPESVKIVCSYKAEKDFLIFRKINRIKFDIYRIPHDSFGWTMEDYNTPYYFVLHPDMKISNIYVPNKSYPEMNKAYLESIKRFLVD